jgi:hypothetical protein
VRACGATEQMGAVRGFVRRARNSHAAARAGAVVDQDGCRQMIGKARADQPCQCIDGTDRTEGNDHPDGAVVRGMGHRERHGPAVALKS